jgi:hypothetical protein
MFASFMKSMMRIAVFCMLLFTAFAPAFAQCGANNIPVNEIGVRLASVTNASSFGGIYIAGQETSLGFFNGLHYKRYGAFGAFRTSLALTKYDYENRRGCPDCLRTNGKVSGVTVRMGYEWYTIMGPFEPYIGLDAVGVFGKYAGETWSSSAVNYQEYTDNRSRRGMGISPVLGLRCYLGYAISVSAETCVDLMFLGRSTRIAQISPETSTYARSNNYFETLYQPMNNLSLNVMF